MTVSLVSSHGRTFDPATTTLFDGVDIDNVEGNLQVLVIGHRQGSVSPVLTDGGDDGWQGPYLFEADIADDQSRRAIAWWWRVVPAAAGNVVVGWDTDPGVSWCAVAEYSTDTGSPWVIASATDLDVATPSSPGATSFASPALAAAGVDELVIGFGSWRDSIVPTELTITDGWSIDEAVSQSAFGPSANRIGGVIASKDGDAAAATWAWTTEAEGIAAFAMFTAGATGEGIELAQATPADLAIRTNPFVKSTIYQPARALQRPYSLGLGLGFPAGQLATEATTPTRSICLENGDRLVTEDGDPVLTEGSSLRPVRGPALVVGRARSSAFRSFPSLASCLVVGRATVETVRPAATARGVSLGAVVGTAVGTTNDEAVAVAETTSLAVGRAQSEAVRIATARGVTIIGARPNIIAVRIAAARTPALGAGRSAGFTAATPEASAVIAAIVIGRVAASSTHLVGARGASLAVARTLLGIDIDSHVCSHSWSAVPVTSTSY